LNEANGPSATRTASPISNVTEGFGRSTPSCTCCRICCASFSEIGAEKAGDARRVLDQADDLIGQVRLQHHVAGEELALGVDLLAATNLDDLFGRDDDLLDLVGKALLARLVLDVLGDLLLEIRVGVDDVPPRSHMRHSP
jgi:hypothetical protein